MERYTIVNDTQKFCLILDGFFMTLYVSVLSVSYEFIFLCFLFLGSKIDFFFHEIRTFFMDKNDLVKMQKKSFAWLFSIKAVLGLPTDFQKKSIDWTKCGSKDKNLCLLGLDEWMWWRHSTLWSQKKLEGKSWFVAAKWARIRKLVLYSSDAPWVLRIEKC